MTYIHNNRSTTTGRSLYSRKRKAQGIEASADVPENRVRKYIMGMYRGSRRKWRSSGFEDGEGIAILFQR